LSTVTVLSTNQIFNTFFIMMLFLLGFMNIIKRKNKEYQ